MNSLGISPRNRDGGLYDVEPKRVLLQANVRYRR